MSDEQTPEQTHVELLKKLQEIRKRPLIAYLTTTRDGVRGGNMNQDAIPVIYEHLRALELDPANKQPLDLLLHTYGGDSTAPWRLMSLLREYASEITLLVPHYAYSAGTLAALGADEVRMHPMGTLGPTDTQFRGFYNPTDEGTPLPIEVEDVRSYIDWVREDVGIRHEDELIKALEYLAGEDRVHPLALGGVKRSLLQSRLMGERLISTRVSGEEMSEHQITDLIESLTARLFYHGHPINRREARKDLKLSWVKDAEPDEADAMWALYQSYVREMKLTEEWHPQRAALEQHGKVPDVPDWKKRDDEPPPTRVEVELDPIPTVRVDSVARSDVQQERWHVTLRRWPDGRLDASYFVRSYRWVTSEP
jgi:hypothetical protein